MIKIVINEKNGDIDSIILKGHALYADYGKDIVCASVSSIAITSINALLKLEDTIVYEENEGLLSISVLKKTNINDVVLKNMISLFEELKAKYPNNINIRRCQL